MDDDAGAGGAAVGKAIKADTSKAGANEPVTQAEATADGRESEQQEDEEGKVQAAAVGVVAATHDG
jgi:hypothetical protein